MPTGKGYPDTVLATTFVNFLLKNIQLGKLLLRRKATKFGCNHCYFLYMT